MLLNDKLSSSTAATATPSTTTTTTTTATPASATTTTILLLAILWGYQQQIGVLQNLRPEGKHALATQNLGNHLIISFLTQKLRKTGVEVASRRTFRVLTASLQFGI
jgi:hypothetical protein